MPVGFAEKRIEAEAQRQAGHSSKLAVQIVPLAWNFYAAVPNYDGIASASAQQPLLWPSVVQQSARRGRVAQTSRPAGKFIDELYRFALSREADELLHQLR